MTARISSAYSSRATSGLRGCRLAALTVPFFMLPTNANAADSPRFARIFGDHAVLQRDRQVHVWGTGAPSKRLTIRLDSASVSVATGTDGQWEADLPAMKAGGPFTMSVEDDEGHKASLDDVMVGDVFLCSGQSNMEFLVKYATGTWGGAFMPVNQKLRFANIAQDSQLAPLRDLGSTVAWQIAGPATTGDTSAVCYFMASSIQERQNVPVGMISSSWGGTIAQAWISASGLRTLKSYDAGLDALETYARSPETAMASWTRKALDGWQESEPDAAQHALWISPKFADGDWGRLLASGSWEESGRPDLASYDGIVWYRQTITLSKAEADSATAISLGPIDDSDVTWINGKAIGAGSGWQTPRNYRVPRGTLKAGKNVIAVRVLDTGGGGGLWGKPEDRKLMFADGTSRPLDAEWRYRIGGQPKSGGRLPNEPWAKPNGLANLYNAMIAPIAPYQIKAVAWYQGESNAYDSAEYGRLLPALMRDWRTAFREPELPFLIVQLAAFGSVATRPVESNWAALRDVQRRVVSADPHAALTVSIDFGDRSDIHPAQKTIIGQRLARNARAVVYGETITPGGPEPTRVVRSGSDLVVHFRNANGGLRTYSSNMAIGFEVCAVSCTYVAATAKDDTVILEGANAPGARRVRYAWANSPVTNLYSADDLPATPFELEIEP